LSQRRRAGAGRHQAGEGVDLSGQDQAMDRESGLWIPASEHQGRQYDDDDEEEEEEEASTAANGEKRGREEERAVEA